MKKQLEDKLAMLAFGDLSPEETARLEQEVAGDREAMLALEDYRSMRTDLKAMASQIPDHQLSTERLRHAILTQGLKPKPARPAWGWLWLPAGAAALVFGFTLFRNLNQPSPLARELGGSGVVASRMEPETGLNFGDLRLPEIEERFSGLLAEPAPPAQPVVVAAAASRPADTVAARPVARPRPRGSHRVLALKQEVEARFEKELQSIVPARERSKPLSSSTNGSRIVLIDGNAMDAATGAARATEVDSASNVLVGG